MLQLKPLCFKLEAQGAESGEAPVFPHNVDAFIHAVSTAVALTNYPIFFVYLDYCHQLRVRHYLSFQARPPPVINDDYTA